MVCGRTFRIVCNQVPANWRRNSGHFDRSDWHQLLYPESAGRGCRSFCFSGFAWIVFFPVGEGEERIEHFLRNGKSDAIFGGAGELCGGIEAIGEL